MFGPSKVLVLGPDSSVSPLILATITPLLVVGDPDSALALAGMLAVLVGVDRDRARRRPAGVRRRPALQRGARRLPQRPGRDDHRRPAPQAVRVLHRRRRLHRRACGRSSTGLDETNRATLITGVCVLAVLLVLPRITTKVPAVLVAVVGATVVSAAFDLAAHGVTTVGTLPQGVPTPALPVDQLVRRRSRSSSGRSASRWCRSPTRSPPRRASPTAAATRSIPTTRWSVSGRRTSPPASSRASRSRSAGRAPRWPTRPAPARRPPALVGAGLVAILLLFLNGLLADLPQTALAAVVIYAALSLMDLDALRRYARVRTSSLVISLVAAGGVIFFGVLEGIVVAIILAVLLFFRRNWWPHGAVLGEVPELGGWHSIADLPGCPAARRASSSSAGRRRCSSPTPAQFRDQVRALVKERQPAWIVLQCEAITDIDVTAAEVLRAPRRGAQREGRAPRLRRAARPGSTTSSTATASTRPSTTSTSTRASSRPWPTSARRNPTTRPDAPPTGGAVPRRETEIAILSHRAGIVPLPTLVGDRERSRRTAP